MGLGVILKAASAVGRLSGVIGSTDTGQPVTARKTRLVASVTALVAALLAWGGIPEPVSLAAVELVQVLANP